MNYNLAIYIKTYSRDFDRVERLWNSIKKHNIDNIPVYISTPSSETELLTSRLGLEYTPLTDESYFTPTKPLSGWEQQMYVKLNVFEAIPTENVLIIDSDAFFIDDFKESDFIAYDNIPYTIIHENNQQSEYETFLKNGNYKKTGYAKAVRAYRDVFGGKSNKIYDYGPNPHLWNRKVIESFKNDYLKANNLTLEQFCYAMKDQYNIHFRETLTYGEYLLATKIIDIIPSGPFFKVYHWKELYDFEKSIGWVDNEKIKNTYKGIILQSNWI